MAVNIVPEWISNLEDEDINFMKKFILLSGSLKELAKSYDITYPTIRLRLDKLIQKIKLNDDESNEPYIKLIKKFAIDEKIDFDAAKVLITEYKKQVKEM